MLEPIASELCRKAGNQMGIVDTSWGPGFNFQNLFQVVCFEFVLWYPSSHHHGREKWKKTDSSYLLNTSVFHFYDYGRKEYDSIEISTLLICLYVCESNSAKHPYQHSPKVTFDLIDPTRFLSASLKRSPGCNFNRTTMKNLMESDPKNKIRNAKDLVIIHPSVVFHVELRNVMGPKCLKVSYAN